MQRKWKPPPEELQQEILILMWNQNLDESQARHIALEKLREDHLYFNGLSLDDLGDILEQSSIITEHGYMPYILGHVGQESRLNYFERYICYLLKYHKKKEVRQLLGCTSSYLSKVLGVIKKKISLSSLEEP